MDYMLNPLICTIWCAGVSHDFAPGVPLWTWKIFFAVVFTLLNIRGVKTSARINAGMAAGMGVVVVIIVVASARYIFGHPHGDPSFFTHPFYDPTMFSTKALFGATSIAVLTYIGFDGISTLSEEAENPRRNIMYATVLTCAVIGVLSAVEVYIAQLVWPASARFTNVDTAYVEVMGRVWPSLQVFGHTVAPLAILVGVTLLLANFGSGMGAQLGAARLLYGMGRSNALPKSFFGAVDAKHHVPRNNVFFVGGIVLIGSFFLSYGLGAEMLNFGALIAFMGVNAAAFLRYFVRAQEKTVWNLVPPVFGFLICLGLWVNLSRPAMIVGSIWMAAGIAFGIWKTRWFRDQLSFEVPAE